MRLGKGKYILACILVLLFIFNPVAGTAKAALSLHEHQSDAGGAAAGTLFQQAAAMFGSLFYGDTRVAVHSNVDEEPDKMAESGLFTPLFNTVGGFLGVILEDEELKTVLGQVLDEILADERIAEYDIKAVAVRALRDERLVHILGSVIARHLSDEELLQYVEQLSAEVAALLKDPAFSSYLNQTIMELLRDDRVNGLVAEIINVLLQYVELFKDSAGDGRLDSALNEIVDELIAIFEEPVMKYADEILEDERVWNALEKILDSLAGLDEQFLNNLKNDDSFNEALDEFRDLILAPLPDMGERLVESILDEEALMYLVEVLTAELMDFGEYSEELGTYVGGNYGEFIDQLGDLRGDLDAVLAAIGAEIGSVLDHYSEHGPFDEPGDSGGGGGCASVDSSEVEDQVGDFLGYWAEVAGWVFKKKVERGDLEPFLEKYFGEDSPYLGAVLDALSVSASTAQEDLLAVVDDVVETHTAGFEERMLGLLHQLLFGDEDDETDEGLTGEVKAVFNEVLNEKFEEMKAGELRELLEGRGEEVFAALKNLLANLPLDFLEIDPGGELGGYELSGMLNAITLELPFEVLADLFTAEDIEKVVDGLFALTEKIPLDDVASRLGENADALGHSIARSLLNSLADSIEEEKPEDPRKEAILAALKSEERLRRLYLDLGGQHPEKITAESGDASIIIAVLLEIAGDQNRVERFRARFEKELPPVKEELVGYGQKLGQWLTGSLRDLAGPFIKRTLTSFFIFKPRGYEELQEDPAGWISYDRFAGSTGTAGLIVGEMLSSSMASRFVDKSLYSFLVEHETVKDIAAAERLSVMQHYFAEIIEAEPLKELKAGDNALNLLELVQKRLLNLRADKLNGLIQPDKLTRDLNSLLAGLLPGHSGDVYRFSVESISLSADKIIEEITGPVGEEAAHLREKLEELVKPVGNLPADLLRNEAVIKARDEVLAEVPGAALELAARVLEDERLHNVLLASINTLIDELLDEALDTADSIVQDPRLAEAVEEAVVTVMADADLKQALGTLLKDMLEDELLLEFVDHLLAASRIIAVGPYSCPSSSSYYRPQNFLGGMDQVHGFEGDPDLPAEFPFVNKTIRTSLGNLTADYYFFEMGCNNGLYMFADELQNWLDPDRAFPHQTLGSYLGNYVPNVFLTESRVRSRIAAPLAALITNTLKGLPAERETIKQIARDGFDRILEGKPLTLIAEYLRADPKIYGMIRDGLAGLPYDLLEDLLRDNAQIMSLLEDSLMALPLEELASYLESSGALKGLIDDAGVNLDLSPLRPLLRIGGDIPQLLQYRVETFPVEKVSAFLLDEQHFYRTAYMVEDLKTRFFADLLTNPGLIELESDLANEIAEQANYSLAEGVFKITERFVTDEKLLEFGGNWLFDLIASQYRQAKSYIRSLISLAGQGDENAGPCNYLQVG